ncbi:MAG: hypothetical protein JO057_06590, partial [Chloroflexi bacterium]|nr:hypothetical protein [Chloroflexota bacterium]
MVSSVGVMSDGPDYDVVIRNGSIYDGSGSPPVISDVAVRDDVIVAVAPGLAGRGHVELDARGAAVAPGFINMLSQAAESLIADGRSQSDIRQGVTLELFGEGSSLGPLSDAMKHEYRQRQGDITYDIDWITLDEGLESLVGRGIACNVASLVGFRNQALKPLTGWTLDDVARARGTSVPDTIIDLIVEDDSRVEAVYFTMSEANVRAV